ncbi:MAG TPA: hypothetical protein VFY85_09850 [Gemmatimonadaceae bacterium]|nr:hypothetical protein [Gemmatimonadaceae bacterium]
MSGRQLRLALFAFATPFTLGAQEVVLREAGPAPASEIIEHVLATPHTVRAGHERLVLSRDSAIATNLLVLGRPTYLAGRVNGDVVVVGADLFLRPGVDVRGRAVAVGGTVATTTLGTVAGGTLSLRDETYDITREDAGFALRHRDLRAPDVSPVVALAGLQGFLIPSYDRVDGLSLPVGITLASPGGLVSLTPTATYRSRLGTVDPGATLAIRPSARLRLEAEGGRATRTNDDWIYSDFVNSATSLFVGLDTRNYFRSVGGTARLIATLDRPSYLVEPYLGARVERVSPISATGDVWSMFERDDSLRMRRPNPLVERGDLRSALAGVDFELYANDLTGHGSLRAEQAFDAPAGTSNFLQLTLHSSIQFPTFGTQSLRVKVHAVAGTGSNVPLSRYAYLGGSGTLATLDLLEQGGDRLLFVENRYLIPIEAIQLPVIGAPVLSLRDAFGGAGVGSLPDLQHEVGIGIGMSALHLDVNTAVAGRKRTKVSLGISLSSM